MGLSVPTSLPAPTGGWNARDSIAAMEAKDAVTLENLWPSTTSVVLRNGFTNHRTGLPDQVQSLIDYNGAATETLFGISDGKIYNVTASGVVGAALVSGLTNSKWQHINIATGGGNYVELCNGADGVYTYDGTNWTDQSASITGVTAANLIHINLHKNRVWFIEVNTLRAWYLPTQSITGAASALDLRAYCPHGGYLMAMGTWTIDAGYGVDDLAVFVTNQGDVAVFRGTDPASASTWALVGIWFIGAPIGRRCMMKFGGDLLIITEDGLQSMAQALQSSRTRPEASLTDKIRSQMASAAQSYSSNFGWEIANFPPQNMLILNIPVSAGANQQQYVMNTITGAWANFTGWAANCWCLFSNNQLYFGGDEVVGRAWNSNADAGFHINFDALQAFNYFGSPGQVKRFTMMRPTLKVNGNLTIQGNINTDFDTTVPVSNLSMASIVASLWDTGVWDTDEWAGEMVLSSLWQGANGIGRAGAPYLAGSINGYELEWLATDVVYESGGIL